MTAPKPTPTAEHIDAVARAMNPPTFRAGPVDGPRASAQKVIRARAKSLLTSTDPAVHAAMLAALVDRLGHDEWRLRFRNGSATRETDDFEDIARWMQRGDVVEARRVLPAQSTPWEVAE